ncbi:MAG: NAD(P)-binding protein, partial [Acidimicrobiales bacterium]|nr:NAD(P)-binding protein [Acidimicrobiales bacterium]
LDEVRERYQRERAKRIRPEGVGQFQDLTGDFARFDADPFLEGDVSRDPVDEDVEVLVLGGGFAGMLTAINLRSHGVDDLRIIDKAGDFGGTWY